MDYDAAYAQHVGAIWAPTSPPAVDFSVGHKLRTSVPDCAAHSGLITCPPRSRGASSVHDVVIAG